MLSPIKQYFIHIRMTVGCNERLCAVLPCLGLERFSPQVGLKPWITRSVGNVLSY